MNNSSLRLFCLVFCACMVFSLFQFSKPVQAQDGFGIKSAVEAEAFFDNIINEYMEKYHLPGAVVSIVKDGRVFLEKGYGYANVEKNTPVTPGGSIFRIGSISKLFTSTAVMQLKEKGKVDLTRDINEYLMEYKIENEYAKPVTMFNLLTHTAGFDDRWTGVAAPEYAEIVPLEEYIEVNMPEIIREPGQVVQYSNHGMTLAGLVVEEVSGMSYEDYLEDNIFKPLGMKNSYTKLEGSMVPDLALEYSYKNGLYKPMQLYEYNIYPAGSICSTASDMGRFMIAHLNNGEYEGSRILNQVTAEEMHSVQFSPNPNIAGMCYGFFEIREGGHRFIAHGGDTNGTHSFLLLDMEGDTGMFVSTNGADGHILTSKLVEKFISHYYTGSEGASGAQPALSTPADNSKLAGEYRSIRYARGTLDKLILLISPQTRVNVEGNSLILSAPDINEKYIQTGPLLFKNTENGTYLSFSQDGEGNIEYMYTKIPTYAYEKVGWLESNNLHIPLIGVFILVFFGWCIYCIVRFFRRKKVRHPAFTRYSAILSAAVSILNIVFVLGMAMAVMSLDTVSDIGYIFPITAKIALISQAVSSVLTAALVAAAFAAWIKGHWNALRRVCFTIFTFCAAGFTSLMYYYNLIGIKY